METEDERVARYEAKMREVLNAMGLGAYVEQIFAQFRAAAKEMVEAETAAKTVVKTTVHLPAYQSYAREIQGIKAKHSGAMAQSEVAIAKARWKARGLTQGNLDQISTILGF